MESGNTLHDSVQVPPRMFVRCKYCRFPDRADFIERRAKETDFLFACRMCGNATDFLDANLTPEEQAKILSGWYEDYDNLSRDRNASH